MFRVRWLLSAAARIEERDFKFCKKIAKQEPRLSPGKEQPFNPVKHPFYWAG
jgi:hypothetical protein